MKLIKKKNSLAIKLRVIFYSPTLTLFPYLAVEI